MDKKNSAFIKAFRLITKIENEMLLIRKTLQKSFSKILIARHDSLQQRKEKIIYKHLS